MTKENKEALTEIVMGGCGILICLPLLFGFILLFGKFILFPIFVFVDGL